MVFARFEKCCCWFFVPRKPNNHWISRHHIAFSTAPTIASRPFITIFFKASGDTSLLRSIFHITVFISFLIPFTILLITDSTPFSSSFCDLILCDMIESLSVYPIVAKFHMNHETLSVHSAMKHLLTTQSLIASSIRHCITVHLYIIYIPFYHTHPYYTFTLHYTWYTRISLPFPFNFRMKHETLSAHSAMKHYPSIPSLIRSSLRHYITVHLYKYNFHSFLSHTFYCTPRTHAVLSL